MAGGARRGYAGRAEWGEREGDEREGKPWGAGVGFSHAFLDIPFLPLSYS